MLSADRGPTTIQGMPARRPRTATVKHSMRIGPNTRGCFRMRPTYVAKIAHATELTCSSPQTRSTAPARGD
eukprot:10026490-Alexandrium_andersonii.AAC.1